MSFYRIKKIKGKEYVYLVKNKWTKKGTRQSVSKYLGKLIRLQKSENASNLPFEISDIDDKDPKTIVDMIVRNELISHGFKKTKEDLVMGETKYKNKTLISKNKVVYHMNEGFFSDHSLKRLLNFNFMGDESSTATEMASAFVNAGIEIPQDIFILFFKKIYDPKKPTRF
jgi:hypothetical protein